MPDQPLHDHDAKRMVQDTETVSIACPLCGDGTLTAEFSLDGTGQAHADQDERTCNECGETLGLRRGDPGDSPGHYFEVSFTAAKPWLTDLEEPDADWATPYDEYPVDPLGVYCPVCGDEFFDLALTPDEAFGDHSGLESNDPKDRDYTAEYGTRFTCESATTEFSVRRDDWSESGEHGRVAYSIVL